MRVRASIPTLLRVLRSPLPPVLRRPVPNAVLSIPALLLAGAPWQATAQEGVEPGAVVTTVVTLDRWSGRAGDSVRYRVEMAEGFRLFAPAAGAAPAHRPARIPVTFGVAASAAAGLMEAGRLVATWPDDVETAHPLTARVLSRYLLRLRLETDAITVAPGETVRLGYRLGNQGNAVDTVEIRVRAPDGWTRTASPARLVLAPGDTAAGRFEVVAPGAAVPGAERVVAVTARGRGAREARSARITVVGETTWFGDLTSLPSTVFLGSTTGTEGVGGVAVRAVGEVRPGTRMTLDFRRSDQPFAAPAFRSRLTGPRFRLALRSAEWRVAGGDVHTPYDPFIGPSAHGTGLDAEWSNASRGAAVLLANPISGLGNEAGHIVRASGHVRTPAGRFTALASDLRRGAGIVEGFRIRAAGLRYDTGAMGNRLAVQAGLMHVATDSSGSETGPAIQADYRYRTDRASLNARVRTVPATVPRTAAYGDELLLSGTAALADGIAALGWGYVTRSPLLGVEPARTRGLVAGVRYVTPGRGTQLQLTGEVRGSEGGALSGARRGLRATVDAPVGPASVEVDAEWGRAERVLGSARLDAPYGALRAGARWFRPEEWAWLGIVYRDYGPGPGSVAVDLAGATRLGAAELQGGLTMRLDAALAEGANLWTGATMDLADDFAATLGIDYSPTGVGDPWRFSVGVTRRFALPLPLRREPAVHGLVYEDGNGNRVRDPGEPTLSGIPVRLGVLSTRTDADGGFRFMDPVRGALQLETGQLPPGLMVPADVHLPSAGFVEIPVVRTAALEVTIFLDRDGDGERDDSEEPVRAVISLVGPDGRTRDVATDAEGWARVGALAPGVYTLRVHSPTSGPVGPALQRSLTVPPGRTIRETIALPPRQREIRMPVR